MMLQLQAGNIGEVIVECLSEESIGIPAIWTCRILLIGIYGM